MLMIWYTNIDFVLSMTSKDMALRYHSMGVRGSPRHAYI